MSKTMNIIFMGTPEFAVPCLDILVKNGYQIVGVITAVDKFGGRGKKTLIESPIKKYAEKNGLQILQPKNLKSKVFQKKLRALEADLQIVVAFRMLPESVWNMPKHGTYNLHGSLLPAYRGAAPINWAIIKGEQQTGVTSFKLKHEIDTGDTLYQDTLPIYYFDTLKQVHDRMQLLAATTILKTVDAIDHDRIELIHQDNSKVSHAPKLFTETCEIDSTKTTTEIHNFIRGLNPFPTAWTSLEDKKLKVYSISTETTDDQNQAGQWYSDNKTYLKMKCSDGYIRILDLQLQGKRRMTIKEFLNGYSLKEQNQ